MSVLIKGMEMPEHCGYCRFRYDGICHALQKTQYSKEDCPLVPVPPHGKLIDADVLYRRVKTECNPYGKPTINFDDGNKVMGMIEYAPTIIPASEEGEG